MNNIEEALQGIAQLAASLSSTGKVRAVTFVVLLSETVKEGDAELKALSWEVGADTRAVGAGDLEGIVSTIAFAQKCVQNSQLAEHRFSDN